MSGLQSLLYLKGIQESFRAIERPVVRSVTAGSLFLSLIGCSTLPTAVVGPEPSDVIAYAKAFETVTHTPIVTGQDYALSGFSYVDHYCDIFFSNLVIDHRRETFARTLTSNSFGAATTILPLTSGATPELQKSIAIIGALSGLTSSTFSEYEKDFDFSPYGTQLRLKVSEAQSDFKNKTFPASLASAKLDVGGISALLQAHQIVQDYARICTLPQFEIFIVTALDKTTAANQPPSGQTTSRSLLQKRLLNSSRRDDSYMPSQPYTSQ